MACCAFVSPAFAEQLGSFLAQPALAAPRLQQPEAIAEQWPLHGLQCMCLTDFGQCLSSLLLLLTASTSG